MPVKITQRIDHLFRYIKFVLGSAGGNKINRVLTESWILEKVLKSLENGNKVWKMVKSLEFFFFFQSYNKFISDFLFCFGQILFSLNCMMKGALFIPAFLKVSIVHLVWKKKLLFWKKGWKKFWILDQKICMNPEQKKLMYYSLLSLKIISFVLFPKALMPSLNYNNIEIGLLAWINYI